MDFCRIQSYIFDMQDIVSVVLDADSNSEAVILYEIFLLNLKTTKTGKRIVIQVSKINKEEKQIPSIKIENKRVCKRCFERFEWSRIAFAFSKSFSKINKTRKENSAKEHLFCL